MPRDAEAWLAERGIEREPIRVQPLPPQPNPPTADPAVAGGDAPSSSQASPPEPEPAAPPNDGPGTTEAEATEDDALTARDASRLAGQSLADAELQRADAEATPDPGQRRLEDDVAAAVAFVRRSTSAAPQSEGRVRDKLAERGWSSTIIDQAMDRARRERLVDDAAMVAALVEERQRKGHAPAKIRRDLRHRGFEDATLDAALARADDQDLAAAAFAVATDKAATCGSLSSEAAFRRVAAHVARRGYPEGLARKVARDAVFNARDDERAAGH